MKYHIHRKEDPKSVFESDDRQTIADWLRISGSADDFHVLVMKAGITVVDLLNGNTFLDIFVGPNNFADWGDAKVRQLEIVTKIVRRVSEGIYCHDECAICGAVFNHDAHKPDCIVHLAEGLKGEIKDG